MTKLLTSALIVLVLAVPGAAQQGKTDPNTVTDKDSGISMTKPADEKWKCYDKGQMWFGENAHVCVSHVIDSCDIEMTGETPPEGKTFGEIDKVFKDVVDKYEEHKKGKDGKDPEWKSISYNKKDKGKFPGTGAFNGYEIDAIITKADDGKLEPQEWVFYKGSMLCRLVCVGAVGEYKKKAKDLGFIFGNIKFGKPEKKK